MEIALLRLIVEHGTLLLFLFGTTFELLGSLQCLEVLGTTFSAFHTQGGLLGNLGLKKKINITSTCRGRRVGQRMSTVKRRYGREDKDDFVPSCGR